MPVTNEFKPITTESHGLAALGGWGPREMIVWTCSTLACIMILTAHQLLSDTTIEICTQYTFCVIQHIIMRLTF
jgi:hypothetical protein